MEIDLKMEFLESIDKTIKEEGLDTNKRKLNSKYRELCEELLIKEMAWNNVFDLDEGALDVIMGVYEMLMIDFKLKKTPDGKQIRFVINDDPLTFIDTPLRENEDKLSRYRNLMLVALYLDIINEIGNSTVPPDEFDLDMDELEEVDIKKMN